MEFYFEPQLNAGSKTKTNYGFSAEKRETSNFFLVSFPCHQQTQLCLYRLGSAVLMYISIFKRANSSRLTISRS